MLRAMLAGVYRGIWSRAPVAVQQVLDGIRAGIRNDPSVIRHLDLTRAIMRRRWRSDELSVGWILGGDEDHGFTRVCAILPHAQMRSLGTSSVILRQGRPWRSPLHLRPTDIERIAQAGLDVVVLHEVDGPDASKLVAALRQAGTKTIYAAGNLVTSSLVDQVDWVVVASDGLRAVAPGRSLATEVIEPAIDAPPGLVKSYARRPTRNEIRVVWVGYAENLHLLAPVREALSSPRLARYRLVTISSGPGVTYQWSRKRVHRQLLDCDIAVLPSAPVDWYVAKPNTRMTMLKALGLPIVASPNPAFTATLTHGQSCYFAREVDEWVDALEALGDFERRAAVGLSDRNRILDTYGSVAVARRWRTCFDRLRAHPSFAAGDGPPGGASSLISSVTRDG